MIIRQVLTIFLISLFLLSGVAFAIDSPPLPDYAAREAAYAEIGSSGKLSPDQLAKLRTLKLDLDLLEIGANQKLIEMQLNTPPEIPPETTLKIQAANEKLAEAMRAVNDIRGQRTYTLSGPESDLSAEIDNLVQIKENLATQKARFLSEIEAANLSSARAAYSQADQFYISSTADAQGIGSRSSELIGAPANDNYNRQLHDYLFERVESINNRLSYLRDSAGEKLRAQEAIVENIRARVIAENSLVDAEAFVNQTENMLRRANMDVRLWVTRPSQKLLPQTASPDSNPLPRIAIEDIEVVDLTSGKVVKPFSAVPTSANAPQELTSAMKEAIATARAAYTESIVAAPQVQLSTPAESENLSRLSSQLSRVEQQLETLLAKSRGINIANVQGDVTLINGSQNTVTVNKTPSTSQKPASTPAELVDPATGKPAETVPAQTADPVKPSATEPSVNPLENPNAPKEPYVEPRIISIKGADEPGRFTLRPSRVGAAIGTAMLSFYVGAAIGHLFAADFSEIDSSYYVSPTILWNDVAPENSFKSSRYLALNGVPENLEAGKVVNYQTSYFEYLDFASSTFPPKMSKDSPDGKNYFALLATNGSRNIFAKRDVIRQEIEKGSRNGAVAFLKGAGEGLLTVAGVPTFTERFELADFSGTKSDSRLVKNVYLVVFKKESAENVRITPEKISPDSDEEYFPNIIKCRTGYTDSKGNTTNSRRNWTCDFGSFEWQKLPAGKYVAAVFVRMDAGIFTSDEKSNIMWDRVKQELEENGCNFSLSKDTSSNYCEFYSSLVNDEYLKEVLASEKAKALDEKGAGAIFKSSLVGPFEHWVEAWKGKGWGEGWFARITNGVVGGVSSTILLPFTAGFSAVLGGIEGTYKLIHNQAQLNIEETYRIMQLPDNKISVNAMIVGFPMFEEFEVSGKETPAIVTTLQSCTTIMHCIAINDKKLATETGNAISGSVLAVDK